MNAFNALASELMRMFAKTGMPPNMNLSCYAAQQRYVFRKGCGVVHENGVPLYSKLVPDLYVISFIKYYGVRMTFFVKDMEEFKSYAEVIKGIVQKWQEISSEKFPKYLRVGCVIVGASTAAERQYYGAWIGEHWDSWRSDVGCKSIFWEGEYMAFVSELGGGKIKGCWKGIYDSWDRNAFGAWNETGL